MKNSQLAAALCKNPKFRLWLDRRARHKHGISDWPDGTYTEEDARGFILKACGIESRSELDRNPVAAAMLQRIRKAFYAYARKAWPEIDSR